MKKSLAFVCSSLTLSALAVAATSCGFDCCRSCCDPCCEPVSQPCCPRQCEEPCYRHCGCCPQPAWCGEQPRDYCDPVAYRMRYN